MGQGSGILHGGQWPRPMDTVKIATTRPKRMRRHNAEEEAAKNAHKKGRMKSAEDMTDRGRDRQTDRQRERQTGRQAHKRQLLHVSEKESKNREGERERGGSKASENKRHK